MATREILQHHFSYDCNILARGPVNVPTSAPDSRSSKATHTHTHTHWRLAAMAMASHVEGDKDDYAGFSESSSDGGDSDDAAALAHGGTSAADAHDDPARAEFARRGTEPRLRSRKSVRALSLTQAAAAPGAPAYATQSSPVSADPRPPRLPLYGTCSPVPPQSGAPL